MRPGRASQTAVMVCMARAAAHGATDVTRFDDPTALALLPDDARARVEQFRAGAAPRRLRERLDHTMLRGRAKMMVARTVAIDDAIRSAACPQLVILGAGLDGRAWRMPELADTVVFEVDHPDSQREKQARATELSARARDVHFVPVDFARDDLNAALDAAGHDPALPTMWVWEGVVMYLTQAEIDASLAVIERRSAATSRLVIAYHSPAPILWLVGPVVRRLGEPLRSAFTDTDMRALLARFHFRVTSDRPLPAIGAALSPGVARATRIMKHLRIVVATAVPA